RTMLLYVYAAVILLCLITFRSWRAVIVAVVPLAITSILCEALMVALGIGVKVATLPVIALGVGIGVDYALYLLSVQLAQQRAGLPLTEAYKKAVQFTGESQSIHVGVDSARRESPFGGTIAHGYLTRPLAASLAIEAGVIPADAAAALNYGLDKVRFIAPVKAGARVRNRVVLLAAEGKPQGRVLLTLQNTIEIEGETKPALIAESLALLTVGASH